MIGCTWLTNMPTRSCPVIRTYKMIPVCENHEINVQIITETSPSFTVAKEQSAFCDCEEPKTELSISLIYKELVTNLLSDCTGDAIGCFFELYER
ncbi:hypothetical protein CEXT_722431 [Caerostris extrusa]|uniref:Uncharacterized protein n=1 Tax=Caerostris extrusa TaxID=172846 RepID=A0AAV4TKD7_CAEEX|nr:hypothetical protein CEXT_722431 [Caerostris extrusa]